MNDKQIEKFVEDAKVLKLVDRIYRGERIDEKQFIAIYNFVKSRGKKTTREEIERTPHYSGDILLMVDKTVVHREGKMYLGIFAGMDSYRGDYLLFHDVRPHKGKTICLQYDKKDNRLFWNEW